MNHQDEDKLFTELYQQGAKDQPPAAIDQAILSQAKGQSQTVNHHSKFNSWRPLMAAASVVLVLPFIWLLSQQPKLLPASPPIDNQADDLQRQTTPSTRAARNRQAESPASPAPERQPAEAMLLDAEKKEAAPVVEADQSLEDLLAPAASTTGATQPKTDSVLNEGESNDADQAVTEEVISITGARLNKASIEANKALLEQQLKGKNKVIKASTMDPLMALEYEQFNRYIELQQFDLADQLLTDIQERFPDYDYEDMIYRLAAAEADQEKGQQ